MGRTNTRIAAGPVSVRMQPGWRDWADWAAHTGQPEALLLARLHSAQEKGLLMEMPEKLRASPQGLLFLNELLALISEE